eukprot:568107-Pyramimonas_sp.AAC.1
MQEWRDRAEYFLGTFQEDLLDANDKGEKLLQQSRGIYSADPVKLLEAEAAHFGDYWKAQTRPPEAWIPDRSCFPRNCPDQIRLAPRSFSVHTAQSLDGLHVRFFSLLSDAGLEVMSLLFEAAERLGLFPVQLLWMLLPLLENPNRKA